MKRPNISIIGIEEEDKLMSMAQKIFSAKYIEENFLNIKKEVMTVSEYEAFITLYILHQK